MKKYVLGLDYGTLSGRALLVDVDNGDEVADVECVYANASIEYSIPGETERLEPETALQDPEDWLRVLEEAVPAALKAAGVSAEQVVGIGVDFTASTPLPVTADGTPLCFDKALRSQPHAWPKLWKHHASQPEADAINALGKERGEHFITAYGGKHSSEWSFAKLLQVLNDAPELYDSMAYWIEACDWLVWQLTGVQSRSLCAAGYKGMWVYPDGDSFSYPSNDFLKALHPKLDGVIGSKITTDIAPLGERVGVLGEEVAARMGLKAGTPVSSAIIDAHAAVPSMGATEPGIMALIMGTSTCCMIQGESFQAVEGMAGAVRDGMIPGLWGYEAGQAAVGDIYHWYAEKGAPRYQLGLDMNASVGDVLTILTEQAAELRIGESGLLALDWWNGNRSTLVDANLSGCIFGLRLSSTPAEIFRTLIEATAFGQRKILDAFESQGVPVKSLYACGGLAIKNPVLMQIYADILGRPIYLAGTKQTCAHGGAMFGAVAAGLYPDIQAAAKQMARLSDKHFEPVAENHQAYAPLYEEYCRLYELLGRYEVPTLAKLAEARSAARAS